MEPIGAQRSREILDALRRGTVPARGLDLFAVEMGRFQPVLAQELVKVYSVGSRPNHRQDPGADRLGQLGPGGHDGGQVGVGWYALRRGFPGCALPLRC